MIIYFNCVVKKDAYSQAGLCADVQFSFCKYSKIGKNFHHAQVQNLKTTELNNYNWNMPHSPTTHACSTIPTASMAPPTFVITLASTLLVAFSTASILIFLVHAHTT